MLNISLRQLHYLVALAETGSFSRAAQMAGVTQSTLSAAIQALEAMLDAPLVDRSGRAIQMLPAGEAVVARAREIIGMVESLPEYVAQAERPLTTRLRLGVIPSVAPFILPKVLPSLGAAFPELRLAIREGLTRDLLDDLRNGRLDAALIARPYQYEGFEGMEIGTDPFYLAVNTDHPLAASETASAEDIAGERLLLLESGHCLREHVISAIGQARTGDSEDIRASSLMTLVQMVEFGLGVTLLPEIAVEAGAGRSESLRLLPWQGEHRARTLVLVWRNGAVRRRDYVMLAAHLRDHCLPRHSADATADAPLRNGATD